MVRLPGARMDAPPALAPRWGAGWSVCHAVARAQDPEGDLPHRATPAAPREHDCHGLVDEPLTCCCCCCCFEYWFLITVHRPRCFFSQPQQLHDNNQTKAKAPIEISNHDHKFIISSAIIHHCTACSPLYHRRSRSRSTWQQ